jgi:transposase
MSRRKKDPLRVLTEQEQQTLQQISRSQTAPAVQVARAKMLLLVAQGADYQDAARAVGRRSLTAVSDLVARFNQEGLPALSPRHGGGQKKVYGQKERERILKEYARTPTPEADGTATWSLPTLQKTLRQAPDGLASVSTYTLWQVLREAGLSCQKSRTWCDTGTVLRKRKDGPVLVTDPDTQAKKS